MFTEQMDFNMFKYLREIKLIDYYLLYKRMTILSKKGRKMMKREVKVKRVKPNEIKEFLRECQLL